MTLWANDKQIGEGTMPQTISVIFTTYAGMDIGRDNGGGLAYEAKAPYAFTGTVKKVVFDLKPAHSYEDEKELHKHLTHVAVAQGIHGYAAKQRSAGGGAIRSAAALWTMRSREKSASS